MTGSDSEKGGGPNNFNSKRFGDHGGGADFYMDTWVCAKKQLRRAMARSPVTWMTWRRWISAEEEAAINS